MGKSTRTTPDPKSSGSWLPSTLMSIPNLFHHSSSQCSRASTPASSYSSPEQETVHSSRGTPRPGSGAALKPVMIGDLHASFHAAITSAMADLRADIESVGTCFAKVEDNGAQTCTLHTSQGGSLTLSSILDMTRHLKDLDNRGRRNNIRLRGLQESNGRTPLNSPVHVFNGLLDRPLTMPIKYVRSHHALQPRRSPEDPP